MTEISPAKNVYASNWKLWLVLAVCLAPVLASYLAYYWLRPIGGQTNYGTLIQPQRPLPAPPALTLATLDGRPFPLQSLQGKWLMVSIDQAACAQACVAKLYAMRQVRLTTNQEQERIERIWLVADTAPVSTEIIRAYDGMHILRANLAQLARYFPTLADGQVSDGIYLIDPLGNLMMQFPKNADLNRVKKDVNKLLKVSSGWHSIKK